MTPSDQFLVSFAVGVFVTLVIQDWMAERRVRKIEREGIGKWMKR